MEETSSVGSETGLCIAIRPRTTHTTNIEDLVSELGFKLRVQVLGVWDES